jgi:hypothetical protein
MTLINRSETKFIPVSKHCTRIRTHIRQKGSVVFAGKANPYRYPLKMNTDLHRLPVQDIGYRYIM